MLVWRLVKGQDRPYSAGDKGASRASRSRGERSWWWPPHGDPLLAVAALEAKTFRPWRGCGGRKLLVIFRSVEPAGGKWRVLTNARSCTEGQAEVASPCTPGPQPLVILLLSCPEANGTGPMAQPCFNGVLLPPLTALPSPDPKGKCQTWRVVHEPGSYMDRVVSFKGANGGSVPVLST